MAGYIRQSTFVDGDTITAALFNNEYNQLVNAFSNTSGHKHDGTTAEGPVIGLIGDAGETSPNNKVLIDTTNNYIEFYVEVSSAPVQQIYIADGAIIPVTDNDIDLGTSSLEFKDIYIDGTATIDTLTVDEAATVGTTLGVTGATTLSSTLGVTGATTLSSTLAVTGATTLSSTLAVTGTSTLTGNVTATNDLSVGGNLTVTGNATISGNLTFGDADTDSINLSAEIDSNIVPNTDDTYDLGTSTKQWRNLYIDGTAEIDTLAIDGTTVTSTAAELNILDGVTSTAAELNILDGVTSTTAELNILDGVTSTATELNIVDGDTAATSTTLADADRVVVNDAGTMKQVALTDFETYFEGALDTLSNVTTVGALNAGSITSGFGAIDNGSSAITTTGTVTYGNLSDGTITITAFVDEDDMSSNSATLVPTQQSVKAYVDTTVAATNEVVEDSTPQLGGDLDLNSNDITGTGNINITGTIQSSGNITGTLATAAQPNITSVGTLTGLTGGTGDLNWDSGTLFVDSSANTVGIGTTSPARNLHVHASNFTDLHLTNDTTGATANDGTSFSAINSDIYLTNREAGNMVFQTSGTERARIDSSGNVGIGTTSPDESLHVAGSFGDAIVSKFENTGSATSYIEFANSAASGVYIGSRGQRLTFAPAGTETMVIDNLGNVGIGTSSPAAELHINDATGLSVIRLTGGASGADNFEIMQGVTGVTNAGFSIYDIDATATRFVIDSSGNVGIGTNSPSHPLTVDTGAGTFSVRAKGGSSVTIASDASMTYFGDTHEFSNAAGTTEFGRFDSSGNLLVGTTTIIPSSTSTTEGISLATGSYGGFLSVSRDGGTAAAFNRMSSDGEILDFRKDGSQVGSIGSQSGTHINIDSAGNRSGLRIEDNGILPRKNQAMANGTVTLGNSSYKFSDLYLSSKTRYQASGGNEHSVGVDANDLIIRSETAGSETARFTYGGNVGIGISSPDAKLHSYQTAANYAAHFESANANSYGVWIEEGASANNGYPLLSITDNGGSATHFRVDSGTGNVGIGEASPEANLHVKNASAGTFTASNSQLLIENNTTVRLTMVSPAANACSIEFGDIDDQNVGVITYDHSGNYMNFKTNASDAMRIDSRGGVVIGDTSIPQYTNLKVYQEHFGGMVNIGHSNTGGTFPKVSAIGMGSDGVSFGHSTNNGTVQLSGSAQIAAIQTASSGAVTDMAFYTTTGGSVAERMRIDSSGNVGIGTTSPSEKLTVDAQSADGVTTTIASFHSNEGESGDTAIQLAVRRSDSLGSDRRTFLNATGAGNFEIQRSGSTKAVIDSSGNVGIGNTSPKAKLNTNLQVEGSILSYMTGTSATFDGNENIAVTHSSSALGTDTAAGLLLANNNNSNGAPSPLIAFSARSASSSYNHTYATIHGEKTSSGADTNWNTGALIFSTGSLTGPNERMRIDSSGNLLLGGTSLLGKFTCHNGGADGVYVNGTGTGYVYRTSNTTGLAGYFVTSSGAAGSISVSGTSTTYNTSSDARLKDVTGSARGLEVINELNPVAYNWKADGKTDEGLIAQEVKEIVPNAVSGSEEEMYQMDYSKLVVHLVKGMKEQQEQIEALQSEINELKNS